MVLCEAVWCGVVWFGAVSLLKGMHFSRSKNALLLYCYLVWMRKLSLSTGRFINVRSD